MGRWVLFRWEHEAVANFGCHGWKCASWELLDEACSSEELEVGSGGLVHVACASKRSVLDQDEEFDAMVPDCCAQVLAADDCCDLSWRGKR